MGPFSCRVCADLCVCSLLWPVVGWLLGQTFWNCSLDKSSHDIDSTDTGLACHTLWVVPPEFGLSCWVRTLCVQVILFLECIHVILWRYFIYLFLDGMGLRFCCFLFCFFLGEGDWFHIFILLLREPLYHRQMSICSASCFVSALFSDFCWCIMYLSAHTVIKIYKKKKDH